MRLPAPTPPDQFFSLIGQRVRLVVDGQPIRGRLLSVRDGFLTIDPDKGIRFSISKYAITTIQADSRPVSKCPKVTRMFWK